MLWLQWINQQGGLINAVSSAYSQYKSKFMAHSVNIIHVYDKEKEAWNWSLWDIRFYSLIDDDIKSNYNSLLFSFTSETYRVT